MISLHPKFEPTIYKGSLEKKFKPETIVEFSLKPEDLITKSNLNKYDHI